MRKVASFFAASARAGPALLACGIFGGVLAPPLARVMHPAIAPSVVGLMTLVLLRVDIPAAFAHLRRPFHLLAIVAFLLLACPLLAWLAVMPLGLDPAVAAGVVMFATGCAATSSPAFARLVGLDPELTLLATLSTTFLVPLTAPPLIWALAGVDFSIGTGPFMGKLALIVGLPLALSLLLRRVVGTARLTPLGPAVDGAVVWLVVIYGIGVMDGLTARALADPAWVAQALAAAFAVDFGLNALTAGVFGWMGRRAACSAGLMSGNRNMALFLATLPAGADPRLALFFALCQFPLFMSPFLLRPVYQWLRRVGSVSVGS